MKYFLFLISLFISLTAYAQNYDCKISHTMVRPEGEMNSSWHVFIKNNSGVIKLDGVLHQDGKKSTTISRQIFFNVENFSKHGYHLISQRIKKNPAENIDDEDMAMFYPDFFIYENRKTMFTITKADRGFIMSWATDPMFFCY